MLLVELLFASSAITRPFPWQIGEKFIYQVKWLKFHLATLEMEICDSLRMNHQKVYLTQFKVRSNPLLFFINLNGLYQSYVDENYRPHLYLGLESRDGITWRTQYTFDYPAGLIHVERTADCDTVPDLCIDMPLPNRVFDGMSLLFYLRTEFQSAKTDSLILFVGAQPKKLWVQSKLTDKTFKIKPVNQKLAAMEINGQAFFTSMAGLTGKFRLWISTTTQAPPLFAEVKVLLGHIKIKLDAWENWEMSAKDSLVNVVRK